MGKSTISTGPWFNSYVSHYQRVSRLLMIMMLIKQSWCWWIMIMIMRVLPTMMAACCVHDLFKVCVFLPVLLEAVEAARQLYPGEAGRLGEVSHRGARCCGRVVEGLWCSSLWLSLGDGLNRQPCIFCCEPLQKHLAVGKAIGSSIPKVTISFYWSMSKPSTYWWLIWLLY